MAINKINSKSIEDLDLSADDLAPGTITDAKIATGTIANNKLANNNITINGTSIALGASGEIVAGTDWQTVKTTDFNAVAGEGYFVDTNSVGAVTATLPGSPSAGDTISFKDYAGTFGTNNLTIGRNGNNIQGVANDSLISTNRASIILVYSDATKGWLYTVESNVADLENSAFISATGGTITSSGDFKIHTFTGDGCFVVSCAGGVGSGPGVVDYLVVAGGGSGGACGGAGGGAGGYRESSGTASGCYTRSPLGACVSGITVSATTYPVTVGGGGSTPGSTNAGGNGSNSVFSTITSTGGGGGSGRPGSQCAGNGGSGGGAQYDYINTQGSGNTPPVSPPQGNPGGPKFPATNAPAGGGGGATAAGQPSCYVNGPPTAGSGGAGGTTSISGTPTAYAGGGGGGAIPSSPATNSQGGLGGGGNGGAISGAPGLGVSGTVNTGGGAGGGMSGQPGGAGGKGIVVIRYKFQ